jgi:hypothetical protein
MKILCHDFTKSTLGRIRFILPADQRKCHARAA